MPDPSLVVVGTGIKFGGHITEETIGHIERAEKVYYGVADPASGSWLRKLNPEAESLPFYYEDRPRRDTYERWIDLILKALVDGLRVCAVFYGHPGVYVYPSHEVVRRARAEGYNAYMLPGISAEDCLIADLGVDPARDGSQSFEATDFLIRPRQIDPRTPLILWQIGLTGKLDYQPEERDVPGLSILVDVLSQLYSPGHEVVVYEAARFAIFDAVIRRMPLRDLPSAEVSAFSTLYVPPSESATIDYHMVDRLGLARDQVARPGQV